MKTTNDDNLKQLDELLAASKQSWFLGAGICVNAGIPLMGPLTSQIFARVETDNMEAFDVLKVVKEELPSGSHIEHILSQLCDYGIVSGYV